MRVPTAEELAAIAAAALVLRPPAARATREETPRWRLAGRLASSDGANLRAAARSASRWCAAGRLDG